MRKALYKKGDVVVCELYEKAVKVLDVRLDDMTLPLSMAKRRTWVEYKVKSPETGKVMWIEEEAVVGQVKYQPVYSGMTAERHVEICQDVLGYEDLRDWLETLNPKDKAGKMNVKSLKRIMEMLALIMEGNSDEAFEAESDLEEELR